MLQRTRNAQSAAGWLCALLLLLATGCQSPSLPFAPEKKSGPTGPYLVLSPRVGLTVHPIEGLSDQAARDRLAETLAQALLRHDVTAGTHAGHRGSASLDGSLIDDVAIEWRIRDSSGRLHVEARQSLDPAQGPLSEYKETDWQRLAEDAAELLDRALLGKEQNSARRVRLLPVGVGPIDGAPGNGRRALAAEVRRALRDAGVPSPADEDTDSLLLIGSIHLGGAAGAQRDIEIVWQLIRPDGSELGRITQRNRVHEGQLEGAWGSLARIIAQAASDGIVDLLRQLDPEVAS